MDQLARLHVAASLVGAAPGLGADLPRVVDVVLLECARPGDDLEAEPPQSGVQPVGAAAWSLTNRDVALAKAVARGVVGVATGDQLEGVFAALFDIGRQLAARRRRLAPIHFRLLAHLATGVDDAEVIARTLGDDWSAGDVERILLDLALQLVEAGAVVPEGSWP